jgi:hypothetical protein
MVVAFANGSNYLDASDGLHQTASILNCSPGGMLGCEAGSALRCAVRQRTHPSAIYYRPYACAQLQQRTLQTPLLPCSGGQAC